MKTNYENVFEDLMNDLIKVYQYSNTVKISKLLDKIHELEYKYTTKEK